MVAYLSVPLCLGLQFGDHERLGVGCEQLGWKMHILDCFFTQVAGMLAGYGEKAGLSWDSWPEWLRGPLQHGGRSVLDFRGGSVFVSKQDGSCLPVRT